jgi:predicted nucleic acid-binding protein
VFLVDTSVWIDYLRGKKNPPVNQLEMILEESLPFGITSVIYQEILQGAASLRDLKRLREYFSTQRFFHPKDNITTYELASLLFFNCRRKGITIRSTIDCLIAQLAIEHKLILLHNDMDFKRIHAVAPQLKLDIPHN